MSSATGYTPADLARITTPTAIVDGKYDEYITLEHTDAIAREFPGARPLIMPDMSHGGHWQNPTLHNRELTAFLDAK